ncbi:MAG TPA: hypothetical protein PLB62_09605 [Candidatus Sumerlaeota bacterium]|nr:hypothetical protein [Candidatus Sumerlaeota bacterium]
MLKDQYNRVILTIIAVSLAIIALGIVVNIFTSSAQAQRPYNVVVKNGPAMDVLLIRDIPVENLESVHILGDNQTFIVQKTKGVAVYRVSEVAREAE